MFTSLPIDLLNEYHTEATKAIAVKDKVLLDDLTKGQQLLHLTRQAASDYLLINSWFQAEPVPWRTLHQMFFYLSSCGLSDFTDSPFVSSDFRDGGGYYIDVGASRLIADKKIKLKQGKEITRLTKDGVLFEDGVELKADIVVFGEYSRRLHKTTVTDVAFDSYWIFFHEGDGTTSYFQRCSQQPGACVG